MCLLFGSYQAHRCIADGMLAGAYLGMLLQMLPIQLEPHLEEGARPRSADDIGAVQVQEGGPDGQHLLTMVFPAGRNLHSAISRDGFEGLTRL